MYIKLLEIYEEIICHNKAEGSKGYTLREVVINPTYIISMRADMSMEKYIKSGNQLIDGLRHDEKFTRISLHRGNSGLDIVVVGSLENINKLLDMNTKKVLKG